MAETERGCKIRHWIGCDSWPMPSVRIASAFYGHGRPQALLRVLLVRRTAVFVCGSTPQMPTRILIFSITLFMKLKI